MNSFLDKISQLKSDVIASIKSYPVTLLSAFLFAIVTAVRIHLDWEQQISLNFLFNCLHWSFAFGAIFSFATTIYTNIMPLSKKKFLTVQGINCIVIFIAFLMLYFLGHSNSNQTPLELTNIAEARVIVAIVISLIALIASMAKSILMLELHNESEQEVTKWSPASAYASSFYLLHRSFFISVLYGGVLTLGVTAVLGAFQALVYMDMSEKVRLYAYTILGFITFILFISHFPSFKRTSDASKESINSNQMNSDSNQAIYEQPKFIQILLSLVVIPVILALSGVLLIWMIRTIVTGFELSFDDLFGISSSYVFVGIWLMVLTTQHTFGITKKFHVIFPIASTIILIFELYAIIKEILKYGFSTSTYVFILIWTGAIISSFFLVKKWKKAYPAILITITVLVILFVMPIVGYHRLPIAIQIQQLETRLTQANMLINHTLVPTTDELTIETRQYITETIYELAYTEDYELPTWWNDDFIIDATFKESFGFDPIYYYQNDYVKSETQFTSIWAKNKPSIISDYDYAITSGAFYKIETESILILHQGIQYELIWKTENAKIPTLEIFKGSERILSQSMESFIESLSKKYPPGIDSRIEVNQEDIQYQIENEQLKILLVFNNVEFQTNIREDIVSYWLGVEAIYLKINE